jgi:hypothetical protein
MMIRLGPLLSFFLRGVVRACAFAPPCMSANDPSSGAGAAHMGSHPGPRHGAARRHYNTPASRGHVGGSHPDRGISSTDDGWFVGFEAVWVWRVAIGKASERASMLLLT